jgi:hypothetical protein
MTAQYTVEARWAPDARVYWAECSGIPGLGTEAPTYDELAARALDLVSELVDTSGGVEVEVAMPTPRTERLPAVA